MKTEQEFSPKSLSFVLSAVLAAFLLFLGVRGMLVPQDAAHGFGIDLAQAVDGAFLRVKAGRDAAFGVVLALLLVLRERRAVMAMVAATVIVPVNDAVQVVLAGYQGLGYALAVHGSAALYGVVLVALLWRRPAGKGAVAASDLSTGPASPQGAGSSRAP